MNTSIYTAAEVLENIVVAKGVQDEDPCNLLLLLPKGMDHAAAVNSVDIATRTANALPGDYTSNWKELLRSRGISVLGEAGSIQQFPELATAPWDEPDDFSPSFIVSDAYEHIFVGSHPNIVRFVMTTSGSDGDQVLHAQVQHSLGWSDLDRAAIADLLEDLKTNEVSNAPEDHDAYWAFDIPEWAAPVERQSDVPRG